MLPYSLGGEKLSEVQLEMQIPKAVTQPRAKSLA